MATETSALLPEASMATPRTFSTLSSYKPITTQFTFPTDESCAGFWKVTSNWPRDTISGYEPPAYITSDHNQPGFADCQPPEYLEDAIFGAWAYSPGVCPEAWTYWDAETGWQSIEERTARCCASGFSLSTIPSQSVFHGNIESVCIHEYTGTDDFIGIIPTSLPTSGLQVHDAWYIHWQSANHSILPSFVTDIPFESARGYGGVPWYDPESGETGWIDRPEVTEAPDDDGDTSTSTSDHESDMQRYGYALLGVTIGVIAIFAVAIWYCFGGIRVGPDGKKTNRRDRRIARQRGQTAESQHPCESSESPVGDETTPMTEPRRQDTYPTREATPPPPYAAEDAERWGASDDNPTTRRREAES